MTTSRLTVSVLGLEGFAPEKFDTTDLALERALDLCEAYPNHTVAIDPDTLKPNESFFSASWFDGNRQH